MTTRSQAVIDAGQVLTRAYASMLGLDGTTVEEAAQRALTPTGPCYEQLVREICASRAHLVQAA